MQLHGSQCLGALVCRKEHTCTTAGRRECASMRAQMLGLFSFHQLPNESRARGWRSCGTQEPRAYGREGSRGELACMTMRSRRLDMP